MNSASASLHKSPPSIMPRGTPIVFVVDDDISVRESLESLIRFAGWQPQIFASAQEFLSCPRVFVPSCLVLDLMLPDLNGLDLQKRIAADQIVMPIIFISGHGDVTMAVRAMKAGAVEFLNKPYRDEMMLSAIEQAIECSDAALRREAAMRSIRDRYASLSCRERQVMTLVVRGLVNRQVGSELFITEITVKVHRGNVMRKMQADSLADLVNMAATLGLASTRKADTSSIARAK
jgi:FixJ family two-component response regulator